MQRDFDGNCDAVLESSIPQNPTRPDFPHPPLSAEEEAKRTYRTLGRKTLDPNEEWTDVTDVDDPDAAGWRFFKVKVEMK